MLGRDTGVVVLRAPCGTGKTVCWIGEVVRYLAANPDARVTVVLPRHLLCEEILAKLEDFADYREREDGKSLITETRVVLCINSLPRPTTRTAARPPVSGATQMSREPEPTRHAC